MAPLSFGTAALPCIQEIQNECFKMGIPLCTRHREVAPNQYEFAPRFGAVTTQIDQNLMIMQIMEEISARYGLAALMHEKPFAGVNGSGKHNNWSIATDEGVNLLNYQDLTADSGNSLLFPVIMAAIVKAVNDHGDLMRMTIACPGNDFRLGACEAPPSIISTYLGESLTKFLEGFQSESHTALTRHCNVSLTSTFLFLPLLRRRGRAIQPAVQRRGSRFAQPTPHHHARRGPQQNLALPLRRPQIRV